MYIIFGEIINLVVDRLGTGCPNDPVLFLSFFSPTDRQRTEHEPSTNRARTKISGTETRPETRSQNPVPNQEPIRATPRQIELPDWSRRCCMSPGSALKNCLFVCLYFSEEEEEDDEEPTSLLYY